QLSHEVKRVDLVNRLREVLHALPDPLRPVAVDDHHGVLVDIIQRVHEPARQLPEIPGLRTEVALVHQDVLATGRMARRPALLHRQQLHFHPPLTAFPLQWHAEAIHFQEQHSHLARPRWRLQLLGLLLHQPLAHRQHHLPDALVADHPVSVQGLQTAGRSPIAVGQHRLPQGPRGQGRTQLLLGRQLQHFVKQVHHLARLPIQVSSAAKREVDAKQRLQRAWLHVPHAKATPVPLFGQPTVDLLQGLHQHVGKFASHPREKPGLQFLQGKAELLAKFVHDEKPLPVVFLADTTRSEDRLLVPSFSSPAPRAVPPGAFTARATHPFNSYPHDPPQSGNAPVLLTHIEQDGASSSRTSSRTACQAAAQCRRTMAVSLDLLHAIPRPEYPRPQFVRDKWLNLNGPWEFAFDDDDVGESQEWYKRPDAPFDRTIIVPFAYQSSLSGIGSKEVHEVVWYRRAFELPEEGRPVRWLLHFGAVDYAAKVWVNGYYIGSHEGGHTPFTFDVTQWVRPGQNTVVVRAEDDMNDLELPRGKQYWKTTSEGIWYTPTTGIWQTVWLEPVSPTHLHALKMTPDVDRNELHLEVEVMGADDDTQVEVAISFEGHTFIQDTFSVTGAALGPSKTRRIRRSIPINYGGHSFQY